MKKYLLPNALFTTLASCFLSFVAVAGPEQPASLDAHLEPLRPLLGKTWKGAFKNSTPEKPIVDVERWERALNGKAVRLLHSLNEGSYGGETIFIWDEKNQTVAYYYFTTGGFMTTGTVTFKDGKMITREIVSGAANGITEVRGTSEIRPDSFYVKTEYLKNGDWVPGHEVTYKEEPSAVVKFK
jgi:hypothetical protein